MKKETEFQVARDGEIIGLFSYMTASSKASFGTLRPSDYACITKKGKWTWVHLYKVLKIYGEFFDELGESELEIELKTETQKAKEFLKLYKKAFDKETDRKKLKEFCVKIVEYEELIKHLGGIKERIRENKAEDEADERKELEEQQKEMEAEEKEIRERKRELTKNLINLIKTAKDEGDDADCLEDWWIDCQNCLPLFCGDSFEGRWKVYKGLLSAFRRIKLKSGELTALAGRLIEAEENIKGEKGKKEAEQIFFAFLAEKDVWAK